MVLEQVAPDTDLESLCIVGLQIAWVHKEQRYIPISSLFIMEYCKQVQMIGAAHLQFLSHLILRMTPILPHRVFVPSIIGKQVQNQNIWSRRLGGLQQTSLESKKGPNLTLPA